MKTYRPYAPSLSPSKIIEPLESRIALAADVGVWLHDGNDWGQVTSQGDTHQFHDSFATEQSVLLNTGGHWIFDEALEIEGDLVITGAESVVFHGAVQVTGNLIIEAGAQVTFDGALQVGGQARIISDEIDFLGGEDSAQIGQEVTLQPHTAHLAVQIGFSADGDSALGLTDSDLAALQAGGKLTIGSAASTGAVLLDSATPQAAQLTIAGSSITVQHTLSAPGGHVALSASGVVRNDGLIDLSGTESIAPGSLLLSGAYVGNFGTILATGSHQQLGGSVVLTSTTQTLVSTLGRVDVSAGSGGSIILWSDTNTTVGGQLVARGLSGHGAGGFVETSSKEGFSLSGQVDTSAVSGQHGRYLIDPRNVTIQTGGGATPGQVDGFADTPNLDATISAATLAAQVSPITIQANNDITVNEALTLGQSLTLQAGRSVLINQNITLTGSSVLTIVANDPLGDNLYRLAGDANISMANAAVISTAGTINLTVAVGDGGAVGGITLSSVSTTGTLNISTAGFVHENGGDAAPSAGAMTSENDLTAATLNFHALSTTATFGEAVGSGHGALEIAAGIINADVVGITPSSYLGFLNLADVDHTNGSSGGSNPTLVNQPVTIGTMNVGGGTVVLTARGASFVAAAGGSPNISALDLFITSEASTAPSATVYYGSIGTLAAPLRTDIAGLNAVASNGGVFVQEANSLIVTRFIAQDTGLTPQIGSGGVVVQPPGQGGVAGTSNASINAGGDLFLFDLKVANQLTIFGGGAIFDGNQDAMNVLARGLSVISTGFFGQAADAIDTAVMTVQATVANGGFYLNEADGINVTSILASGPAGGVSIVSGAGSITVGTIAAGSNAVTIRAAYDSILDGNAGSNNITAGRVTLEARNAIGSNATPLGVAAPQLSTKATLAGGGTYVAHTGSLNSLAVETNAGPVNFTLGSGSLTFTSPTSTAQLNFNGGGNVDFSFDNAGGKLALGTINAGTGAVVLKAKTALEDAGSDSALNVTAGALTLTAGMAIGAGNAIETNAQSIVATAAAGSVFISESSGLSLLTATAAGTGAGVAISAGGDVTIGKVTAPGDVNLSASGNLLRSGNVVNVSGATAILSAGGTLGTSVLPLLLSVGTLTSATANSGIYLKAKSALVATLVDTATGHVELAAENDLTLGLVETNGAGTLTITSSYGGLLDGNLGSINLRGGGAILNASQIGSSSDALETELTTIDALSSEGGIDLSEADGIAVTRLEAIGDGANIKLTANGNIQLGIAKAEGDNVTLTATGGAISDNNGADLNITAKRLDISATGGIGDLENNVSQLGTANGGVGGTVFSNLGALALLEETLEGAGELTITAGSITILDFADNLVSLSGSLTLQAAGNIVFLDRNDTLQLGGSSALTVEAGLGLTPAYPETGAVAILGNVTTGGGNISVHANHHVTLGLFNAGVGGDVTIISDTGSILDGNGSAVGNIIGDVVTLSAVTRDARVAQLETSIRIADYAAYRSEAAAKLSTAQSLLASTVILKAQAENALENKKEAKDVLEEAEADSLVKDQIAQTAYIAVTVADGVALALNAVALGLEIAAGIAQAIPATGDLGAMEGFAIADVAATTASATAYALGIVATQLENQSEQAENILATVSAEYTAYSAVFEDSLATFKAFKEGTSIAKEASDAAAIQRDHSLQVRDQAIQAEDQANALGSAGHGLQIQANSVNANNTDGSVYLNITGGTTLTGVTATGTNAEISIQATGAVHLTGALSAAKQVSLQAGDAITTAGGSVSSAAFVADATGAVATNSVPLVTTVGQLAVKSGGGVFINNAGALELTTLNNVSGVTAAGPVTLTTSGALTLKQAISSPGQQVSLSSGTGSIVDSHDGTDVVGSSLIAIAHLGIDLDTDVNALTANSIVSGAVSITELSGLTYTAISAANGAISLQAGGALNLNDLRSLTDGDANDISVTSTAGDISVNLINAGTVSGDVSINAIVGSVHAPSPNRITADSLTVTAATGATLTTTVNSVDVQVTGAGDLFVLEANAINVKRLTTQDGYVELRAQAGAIALEEGAINAGHGTDLVSLFATGNITGPTTANDTPEILGSVLRLETLSSGSTIGASAPNPLEIRATERLDLSTLNGSAYLTNTSGGVNLGLVTVGTGNLHLKSIGGSILATSPSDGAEDMLANHLNLVATGASSTIGGSEGAVLEFDAATLTVQTDGGSAYLADLNQNLAVNTLNVGGGNLFLRTVGALTDNDNSTTLNITANFLGLTAGAGIGASGNRLEITVANLEAIGGTGGIFLDNLGRGLTIGGVSTNYSGLSVTGGEVTITADGDLNVNEVFTVAGATGGAVTLQADGAVDINAAITHTGGAAGALTITAGGAITVDATISNVGGIGGSMVFTSEDAITFNSAVSARQGTVTLSSVTATIISAELTNTGATGGAITITAAGAITVDDDGFITNTGGASGAITLDAGGAILTNGFISNLTGAGGAITLISNAAVTVNDYISGVNGVVNITAVGGVTITDAVSSSGLTGGAINIDTDSFFTLSSTGSLTNTASTNGAITITADGAVDVDGTVSNLGSTVGGTIAFTTLSTASFDGTVSGTGGALNSIFVDAADDITVTGTVLSSGALGRAVYLATDGLLSVSSSGSIRAIGSTSGAITALVEKSITVAGLISSVGGAGGALNLAANEFITVTGTVSGAHGVVDLIAEGAITITGTVSGSGLNGRAVTLDSEAFVKIGSLGAVQNTGGNSGAITMDAVEYITVEGAISNLTGAGGSITLDAEQAITIAVSGSIAGTQGTIELTTESNAIIDGVITGSGILGNTISVAAGGFVDLDGSITNAGGTSGAVSITADSYVLVDGPISNSGSSVGGPISLTALGYVTVNDQITATGGSIGTVSIDAGGDVDINAQIASSGAVSGDITVLADGRVDVDAPVISVGGAVLFTTTDVVASGQDIRVTSTITGRTVTLRTGDDLFLVAGSLTTATNGAVTLLGDYADADLSGPGSTLQLKGAIRGNHLEIVTGVNTDTVTISDVVVSTHQISTGAGADEFGLLENNTIGTGTISLGADNDAAWLRSAVDLLQGGDHDDAINTTAIIRTYQGGSGADSLLLHAGGSITISADGGDGADQISYDHDGLYGNDFTGPVTVNLQTRAATAIALFTGWERIEGTNSASDVLIGADNANTWHVTGANAGDIGGPLVLAFSGFENLTGGTANDAFLFSAAGSISGNLNGAGASTRDSINYQTDNFNTAITAVLDGPVGGTTNAIAGRFDSIEEIVGDGDFTSTNSLTGANANIVWTFTDNNTGHLNGTFYFQNFADLNGGNANDVFAFANGVIPTATLNGGTGYNTLDLSAWTTALKWTITGDNVGTVNTSVGSFDFTEMSRLLSGAGNDTFIMTVDDTLGFGLATPGALSGGDGTDFLDLSGYTDRNLWTRSGLDGNISTDRGQWTYAGIEQYLGSEASTFLFDVVDLRGEFVGTRLPAQLLPGTAGTVTLSVVNIGNDEVLREAVDVQFYLSLDGVLDGADILIGSGEGKSVNLFQGATRQPFATNTLVPVGTVPGTYQLLAVVDSSGEITEANEGNNLVNGGTIEVLPVTVDLQPSAISTTLPAEVLPGAKATLRTTIINNGNSPAVGLVDVEFFLSLDGTYDAGDIALGGFAEVGLNLAAGASRTFSFLATIPSGLADGNYQVIARVDGQDAVIETNEANNTIATGSTVHVFEPFVDLVTNITAEKLPDIAIPNDILRFKLPIQNLGNIPVKSKLGIKYYLSTDNTLDAGDLLVKTVENVPLNLGPNRTATLNGSVTVPNTHTGGTYYILAEVDSGNLVGERTETNNTASSLGAIEVVWRFGNFGDRRGVKLTVPDAQGQLVTFSMSGEGAGDIVGGSDFLELSLVGTNERTAVNVKTPRGVFSEIGNITSTNSLGRLHAPTLSVNGDVTIDGGIGSLTLRNLTDGTLSLGTHPRFAKSGAAIRLMGNAQDYAIASATKLRSLMLGSWLDTDAVADLIQAPEIGSIRATGSFQADITATSASLANVSLASLYVTGNVSSQLSLVGGAGAVNAGNWSGGGITADSLKSFTVRGNVVDTEVTLAGAPKAFKTSINVIGAVADSLFALQNATASVRATEWDGSVLALGVDSGGDGDYFDGDEVATGGGTLAAFTTKTFNGANGGSTFGIAADRIAGIIRLNSTTFFRPTALPATVGDFRAFEV